QHDAYDLLQRARVRNAESRACGAGGPFLGPARATGRDGHRSDRPGRSAWRVAEQVALADVPARAPWNREVDVVVCRLELDPAIFREVHLDPGVRVLAAHDEAVDAGVVAARAVAADEASGDAKRPEHVCHCGREERAVALVGVEQEVWQRIYVGWRGRRVE